MILKGKKTILRSMRMEDAANFVRWLSDPQVNKFTTRRKVTLRAEQTWIRALPKNKNDRMFSVCAEGGMHIGSIGLHKIDKKDGNAMYSIFIGEKSYWGEGYGSDATRTILDYGFRKLKLHRIYLFVYSYNKRAIHLYKKLGFKMEGRAREQFYYKGKFHDDLVMGLLDREWKKRERK